MGIDMVIGTDTDTGIDTSGSLRSQTDFTNGFLPKGDWTSDKTSMCTMTLMLH